MLASMPKKKPDEEKPSKGVRTGTPRSIYFPQDINEALLAYLAAQRVPPTATDTVLVAVQEFLQREGFYPAPGEGK